MESIHALRVARDSAVKARTAAVMQLGSLVVSAPPELRAQLQPLRTRQLIDTCARYRPGALADRARRRGTRCGPWRVAGPRCTPRSPTSTHPDPRLGGGRGAGAAGAARRGVQVAAALLVAVGDNPERLRSEAAFAHLCGVAPLPASSGRTVRHRLNHGGDHRANNAYVTRRTAEGLSKREIIRCLKRYVAREVHRELAGHRIAPPLRG